MLESWRKKIHSPFANNIWGAAFVDMQFISKFSIYAWVIHSIDKKGIRIVNDFKKILNESNCKSKKIGLIKAVNLTIDQWNYARKKCYRNVFKT